MMTTRASTILRRRFIKGDATRERRIEAYREKSLVAREIFALRTKAGLTQKQLAAKIGTTASVVCQLEDADYYGHSLNMLRRVAAALDTSVEVTFGPSIPKDSTIGTALDADSTVLSEVKWFVPICFQPGAATPASCAAEAPAAQRMRGKAALRRECADA